MENDLKAGDIVSLKSGGPEMTIGYVDDYYRANCYWFVAGESRSAQIFVDALEKV